MRPCFTSLWSFAQVALALNLPVGCVTALVENFQVSSFARPRHTSFGCGNPVTGDSRASVMPTPVNEQICVTIIFIYAVYAS